MEIFLRGDAIFINLLSGAKAWWLGAVMVAIVAAGAPSNSAQRLDAAEKAKDQAIKFGSIKKVITKWNPDQHLYVHGDIGVGKAQLAELEQWLDANAAHWTVVLMSDADDQRFTHTDGRQFTGMDAVEYALGSGLSNRTDFGKLEHPVTHQADGTVFVLFLKERKLSYFGSAAQDCHSVGEAHWTGQLDQPAVHAMRSGGRILDAVKETVKLVNCKLEEAIQAEKSSGR